MVENKPQRHSRYSDKELQLINNTFAGNDELLMAMRKVMIQQPITEQEDVMVKSTFRGEVKDLIYKLFIPKLDGGASMTNLADVHFVATDDRPMESIYFDIMVNRKKFEFLEQQLAVLCQKGKEKIKLDDFVEIKGLESDEICINYTTRSKILNHVESMLQAIKVVAGQQGETVEEQLKRMGANSSK